MNRFIKLVILFFLLPFIVNAQIGDTIIKHNNEKIYKFNGINYFPLIFNDIDYKENNWLGLYNKGNYVAYKVDNNLNIIDSIKASVERPLLKYNNKLYGINMHNCKGLYLDTIRFYSYDINGNPLINKVISTYESDTMKYYHMWSYPKFTKEGHFVLFLISFFDDIKPLPKIIKIDTMGNIMTTKTYKLEDYTISEITETDNNYELLLNKLLLTQDYDSIFTKILVLDKNTLDIVDSIVGFNSRISTSNFYNINDSIFVTIGNYIIEEDSQMQVNIANRNTYENKTIKFPLGISNSIDLDYFYPELSKKLDYLKTDSIYFVCYSYKDTVIDWVNNPSLSSYQIIRILNFNINGELNFDYAYDLDTNTWKYINGIRATSDGGLIIAVTTFYEGYFIKFMPNGFVSITNIETNEKASIKVYPNPAKDFINVDIEADRFSSSEIELFDIQGRLVKKSKLNAQIGNRIDVSTLNPGAYTYRVVINGKGISGKVIIGE